MVHLSNVSSKTFSSLSVFVLRQSKIVVVLPSFPFSLRAQLKYFYILDNVYERPRYLIWCVCLEMEKARQIRKTTPSVSFDYIHSLQLNVHLFLLNQNQIGFDNLQ